ncbi:MAG: hypothetical protein ETSY2_43210 [Candidatus Entotheonella gemina]|uniref:Uncharacterized protein n=1 Tax=Candidatus Entotheonella gemina TaxID=1429439 RepID=W4LLC3_9BACT|nr:MAG: hypothetical protein ETSY2_43210 [Candidatus Entotheonella gemina]
MPPTLLGQDLTSNRFDALNKDTLQVVAFYDGQPTGNTSLWIQYWTPTIPSTVDWIVIDNLQIFGTVIETREYHLDGCLLTGAFQVVGVVPNGVIDGLAFALFWKDVDGNYHVLHSTDSSPTSKSNFVGAWPAAMDDDLFRQRTPQITDGVARHQARMAIYGAKYLRDGYYTLSLF